MADEVPWATRLQAWFRRHRRVLPWRSNPSPYRVWVSEVMLQQTRVAAARPYFERFLQAFPSVRHLAAAQLHDVLRLWEGLGYYGRARNLHRAAAMLVRDWGGELPADVASLRRLPGVGVYTAAAIASIAYGLPYAAVDGNVLRVMARFRMLAEDIGRDPARRRVAELLEGVARQSGDPSAFNQGLMELGALVCTPRAPRCGACPLAEECLALAAESVDAYPVKAPRRAVPHVQVAIGLLAHAGKVLIARRSEDQMLGGLWEFPGGKQQPGESLVQTVEREMLEEVNLRVRARGQVAAVQHAYSHFRMTMTTFRCELACDPADLRCDRPTAWVPWERLHEYPFPGANHKLFKRLGADFGTTL
ncbi:MAG: A/G-specific adenine glycosylase [Lentisphaeria bacterium]|nr:A/G-specific adenine glycosylase [Lentisphaeria bacterium]